MAAGNGESDLIALVSFDVYPRKDLLPFDRPGHISESGICESAVILAQMAAEAPFFIDINTFHNITSFRTLSLARMRDTENTELFFIEPDATEHEPVAPECLDRVYTHSAHDLHDLVPPR